MSTHAYLVQLETQDQEPDPVSVHLSLLGALKAAEEKGADVSKVDPHDTNFTERAFGVGGARSLTVVCIHRLELKP